MHVSVRESQSKQAFADFLGQESRVVSINSGTDLRVLDSLSSERLVVKPDVLIGKRGKSDLLALDVSLDDAKRWLSDTMGSEVDIDGTKVILDQFLVEPFVAHTQEYYFAITTEAEVDVMQMSTKGGADIEDDWERVQRFEIPLVCHFDRSESGVEKSFFSEKHCTERDPSTSSFAKATADESVGMTKERTEMTGKNCFDVKAFGQFIAEHFAGTDFDTDVFRTFAHQAYEFFVSRGYVYFEINPLVIKDGWVAVLDLKSRVDSAEAWKKGTLWKDYFEIGRGERPFARTEVEARVEELDAMTGSSLKMKILNKDGSIWPLVAGGGASVLMMDAVTAAGAFPELGMYGEYSGNPAKGLVAEYTDSVLQLLLDSQTAERKVLLIAGGIANFTDVAKTFGGISEGLRKHRDELKSQNVKVLVRRGGPNYKMGLANIKQVLDEIGVENEVYGPEVSMTSIVNSI